MALKDHLLSESQSADSEYDKRQKEMSILLRNINDKLKKHKEKFEKTGDKDWGYVGDLGNVIKHLKEIDDFLR